MIKSQSTWNQPFNSISVLDLDIVTFCFGQSTKFPDKQFNEKHGVNATKFWFFEKTKKFHDLNHQYVSEHIKVGVLRQHANLRQFIRKKKLH